MSKKKEHLELHLPEDILVKILCRLPVKSLMRLTFVSKQWHSIILHDPKFSKSQLQLASQHQTLRQRVLIYYPLLPTPAELSKLGAHDIPKLPSRFQSLEDNFSGQILNFPGEENRHIVLIGSCNGLLALAEDCWAHCSIWNPSTGFFRSISSQSPWDGTANWMDGNENCAFYINHGFGHVFATDDYKLVCVLVASIGGLAGLHVFSVRDNFWKVRAANLPLPGLHGGPGTLSNEALHWISYPENELLSSIYAFDLAEEEFRQVSLPVFTQIEDTVNGLKSLILLNGCLCVWFVDSNWHYNFWAMTEYAVTKSWVKLFQFSVHDLPDVFTSYGIWDPIFITEGGTVVIKLDNKEELVKIELRKEEKSFCSGRYRLGCKLYFDTAVYDETLVSVPS